MFCTSQLDADNGMIIIYMLGFQEHIDRGANEEHTQNMQLEGIQTKDEDVNTELTTAKVIP
jgi:hypothetical protein